MTDLAGRLRSWIGSPKVRIAMLFCVVALATRIPFRAQILHHWDSVNFALALDHFDVRLHQPHPPGTFVIYILLGRLFQMILRDQNASLVWLSVVLSGLGTATLFLLGEKMYSRRVGVTTALLAIVSPLVWFHGEVALSYMLEFFWVPLVVYLCYEMRTKRWWALFASALLIGMAGGVRPNTPVFLLPLWIVGALVHRYSFRNLLLALLVMGLGVLIWAVPMVVMSGGLMEYIEVMRWWQYQHTAESASLYGTLEQVIRFGAYAVYSLGLGAISLVVASARHLPGLVGSIKRNWGAQVLAAWTLPATVYLTIIHLRQPGHTFTIQPALLLLAGLAIVSLASRKGAFHRGIWIGVTAVVVIANALFFLTGPTYLFGDTRMLFTTPSWGAIRDYDEFVISRLDVIRERFARDETAVLASGRNFRLPDFYLSDFQLPSLSYEINRSPVTLSDPINTLVFFDDTALPGSSIDTAVQSVPLPDGDLLRYITWDESQVVEVGPGWLQIHHR